MAAANADIRFSTSEQGPFWAGQAVELHLELWSDGFSFADQLFSLPEIQGAFLVQADASTVKLNEQRDGNSWQGLRYTLMLFPQSAGTITVPPFPVRFSVSTGFGQKPSDYRFTTPELNLESLWPPGASTASLMVSTSDFEMEVDWSLPVSDESDLELNAGDALQLEVSRSAGNVSAMAFTPVNYPDIEGVGIYTDKPRVEDRFNRGELLASRTDRVSFVFERAGRFELPELSFEWWDPQRERLHTERVPSVRVLVTAASAAGAGQVQTAQDWRPWLQGAIWLISALVLLSVGYRRWGDRLRASIGRWAQAVKGSEPAVFRSLVRSCRKGEAAAAWKSLDHWLSLLDAPTGGLNEMASQAGLPEIPGLSLELQSALMSGERWRGDSLARQLTCLRAARLKSGKKNGLPALNPR